MKRGSLTGMIGALAAIVTVLVAALPAAGAGPATFRGVVVAKDSRLHGIAVAAKNGVVRTVRVAVREPVGARVDMKATRLRDGTFRATRISSHGRTDKALIRGAVVVRQLRGRLLVRAGRSAFSIRWARRTSALAGPTLRPGTVINATVGITPAGELDLDSIQSVEASGTTGATGPTGATGDDQGENDDDCAAAPSGPSGPTGDDQGENDDDCGPSGPSGASGPSGPTGASGPTGPCAAQGDDQDEGDDGCGPSGSSGPSGLNGDDQSQNDDQGGDTGGGDD
jgi:hypothetical protein